MNSQWSADLIDVQALAKDDIVFKYLLTCVDMVSQYAWVVPLKDNKGDTLEKAFHSISSTGPKLERLTTDKGTDLLTALCNSC